MSDKDIKRHMDLAKNNLKKQVTKEEAMYTFVMAGILNWDGTYTDNYPYLKAWQAKKKNNKCTVSGQI